MLSKICFHWLLNNLKFISGKLDFLLSFSWYLYIFKVIFLKFTHPTKKYFHEVYKKQKDGFFYYNRQVKFFQLAYKLVEKA